MTYKMTHVLRVSAMDASDQRAPCAEGTQKSCFGVITFKTGCCKVLIR